MANQKSKYVQFGALIKGKDGGFYIRLDDNLKLNINGKPFSGKYLSADKPDAKLDRMVKAGVMDEEEAERRRSNIPEYVRLELNAKLD